MENCVYVATLVPRKEYYNQRRPILVDTTVKSVTDIVLQFGYSDWETIYDHVVVEAVPLGHAWPMCRIVDWYKYDRENDRYNVLMPAEWPKEHAQIGNFAIG